MAYFLLLLEKIIASISHIGFPNLVFLFLLWLLFLNFQRPEASGSFMLLTKVFCYIRLAIF